MPKLPTQLYTIIISMDGFLGHQDQDRHPVDYNTNVKYSSVQLPSTTKTVV